jgi:hypothetical protein
LQAGLIVLSVWLKADNFIVLLQNATKSLPTKNVYWQRAINL